MDLQLITVLGEEGGPVKTGRDDGITVEGRSGLLVGHLEEQQIGELLDVATIRQTVITEHIAVRLQLADQGLRVTHRQDPALTAPGRDGLPTHRKAPRDEQTDTWVGVPAKVVSGRLGHANVAFTMSVYQHILPGMQADAAHIFAKLVFGDSSAGPG